MRTDFYRNTQSSYFAGCLAIYKYYNMDQVVAQALTLFEKVMEDEASTSNGHARRGIASDPTSR